MSDKSDKEISKFISLILRHRPDVVGITLDDHGWANVDELIDGVKKTHELDRTTLEKIVYEDEKQRYSFSDDRKLIRANQGHSIPVDVELKEITPPEILYHGTGIKYKESIDDKGLVAKSRLYVHLSGDVETAKKVGKRHGKPIIYIVNAAAMSSDGYQFFQSLNGVWLTREVPRKYLELMDEL